MQNSRRDCLKILGSSVLGLVAIPGTVWGTESLRAQIVERRIISWKPPLYHGWPTLTRRANGELLLAFSGGREAHVCPFGRLELMRSKDDGKTWGWPQVIYDGPIDDRDAGVMETSQGTLLLTNFTSLAYVSVLTKAESNPQAAAQGWDAKKFAEWQAAHQRITTEERQREVGTWMWRSTDGGVTWSARYAVPCHSPHGPIALKDGRLLYPGISLWAKERIVGVWESKDDGLTWSLLSRIPLRKGDDPAEYHELHAVEAANGTIVCHIRNNNPQHKGETLQCESRDNGKTWSEPHAIGVWGLPSHLLTLKDGRLLMSYGHRRPPFGVQVRVSENQGQSWSEPLTISDDGHTGDLGYPSTVETNEGTFVTVWYELLKGIEFAQLRQARWKLSH